MSMAVQFRLLSGPVVVRQALKYLKIGTCPASQKLLTYMDKILIYIGNHPNFTCPAA